MLYESKTEYMANPILIVSGCHGRSVSGDRQPLIDHGRRQTLASLSLLLGGCVASPQRPDGAPRDGPCASGPGADIAAGGEAIDAKPGAPRSGGQTDLRAYLAQQYQGALARTQDQLRLMPDQQSAWGLYREQVSSLLSDVVNLRATAGPSKQNALSAIGARVDRVRNRLAAMEAVNDAAQALYTQLSSEQRLIADRLLITTVPNLYGDLADGPTTRGRPPARPGAEGTRDRDGPGRSDGMRRKFLSDSRKFLFDVPISS